VSAARRGWRPGRFAQAWRSWLEPAVALGLSALYLAAAVGDTLALLR
jgi:hypothetical protein